MQCNLFRKLMLYKLELGNDAAETTKNICCTEWRRRTVTKWFTKFCSIFKTLNSQAKSGRPKSINCKTVLKDIEADLMVNTWRVSGEFSNSESNVVGHFHDLDKTIHNCQIVAHVTKIVQNNWLAWVKMYNECNFLTSKHKITLDRLTCH